tara:strand:+ start:1728 stop:2654 length:927 start_codon:yes stop_codon:yes gene_type:complete
MKILITGVSSFTGYHLAKKLSEKNKVYGVISKNINKYKFNRKLRILNLVKRIDLVQCDLYKRLKFKNILNKIKPKIIYINHAYTTRNPNEFNIYKSLEINSLCIEEIFIYSSKNNCRVFHTGTNQEYGVNRKYISENTIKKPNTAYGLSKKIQCDLIEFYSLNLKVNTVSFKLFNLYGTLDEEHKIIQNIIKSLGEKNKVKLNTNGIQNLDFLNINKFTEIVEKYLKYVQKNDFEEFIISSNAKIALKELIYKIVDELKLNRRLINFSNKDNNKKIINIGYNKKIKNCLNIDIKMSQMINNFIHESKN